METERALSWVLRGAATANFMVARQKSHDHSQLPTEKLPMYGERSIRLARPARCSTKWWVGTWTTAQIESLAMHLGGLPIGVSPVLFARGLIQLVAPRNEWRRNLGLQQDESAGQMRVEVKKQDSLGMK